MEPNRPKYLTTAQAAAHCAVSPKTIRRWVAAGRLPAKRTSPGQGGLLRIRLADLEALLAGTV